MGSTTIYRKDPELVTRVVKRRNIRAEEIGDFELDPSFFGLVPNVGLMHQVVVAQLAAARAGTHSTLRRREVRGGGAKPYRQKGTGRARQGSNRAAQWTGGGIAHGPKPRDHSHRTPRKMIRQALRCALSDRAAGERVAIVDAWNFGEPSTKAAVDALITLGLEGRVLVVLADGDGDRVAELSLRNLPQVQTIPLSELNTYDVLRNDWVVFTDETMASLTGGEIPEAVAPVAIEAGEVKAEDGEGMENPAVAGGSSEEGQA